MNLAGSGRDASPVVRPIGVSPALEKVPPETWYRGNKWPPGEVLNGKSRWHKRLGDIAFPAGAWSSQLLGIATIGEFVQASDGDGNTWIDFTLPDYGSYPLADELDELAELIEYRPGVLAEALAQRNNDRRLLLWALELRSGLASEDFPNRHDRDADRAVPGHVAQGLLEPAAAVATVSGADAADRGSGACRLSERPRDGGISRREGARGNPAAGCLEPDPGADLAPSADA
jgi:hypothetical protein